MRHRVAGRILGRSASHRKALFRNLVRELYLHERITTTEAKARAIRADAEKLITKAKLGLAAGGNRVHAQRQVVAYLNDKGVAHKVFEEIAPRYAKGSEDLAWRVWVSRLERICCVSPCNRPGKSSAY